MQRNSGPFNEVACSALLLRRVLVEKVARAALNPHNCVTVTFVMDSAQVIMTLDAITNSDLNDADNLSSPTNLRFQMNLGSTEHSARRVQAFMRCKSTSDILLCKRYLLDRTSATVARRRTNVHFGFSFPASSIVKYVFLCLYYGNCFIVKTNENVRITECWSMFVSCK